MVNHVHRLNAPVILQSQTAAATGTNCIPLSVLFMTQEAISTATTRHCHDKATKILLYSTNAGPMRPDARPSCIPRQTTFHHGRTNPSKDFNGFRLGVHDFSECRTPWLHHAMVWVDKSQ